MKKIFITFISFICIIFLIPFLFTKSYNKTRNDTNKTQENLSDSLKENISSNKTDEIKLEKYNYKEYTTVKLLHAKTGQIEEMDLDEYLLGVVSAEMPASFEEEALKAQAVVARTYTIYSISHNKSKHENADICDDSNCCQAWISKEDRLAKWDENLRQDNWNKILKAISSTTGKIITYNGEAIDAFFHSNSGGTTETPVNVWGGTNYPYLQSVQTSGEDAYSQYSSEVILNKKDFSEKIKVKHNNFSIDYSKEDCIQVTQYTDSGRVKTIKIGNLNLSGVELRTLIGLKSANFKVEVDGENIKFEVTGYGHGVGMSQTGADSMAKQGSNFEEIIKHFYTGIEIISM